jgi:hypothetical protein
MMIKIIMITKIIYQLEVMMIIIIKKIIIITVQL